jgi:hypothetical protein
MGFRLSFGIGPLRYSKSLSSKKKRRGAQAKSSKTAEPMHGIVKNERGKVVWTCEHNHKTQAAAKSCADRYIRNVTQGK